MTKGISRRAGLAGLLALTAAPALARTRKPKKAAAIVAEASMLEEMADRLLALMPETGTYNGVARALDGGALARRLDDYSPSGEQAFRDGLKAERDLLARMALAPTSQAARHLPVISAVLENATRSASIPYGKINAFSFSGHVPYVVSQIAGPAIDSVSNMAEQQSLATEAAVEAWLEKLAHYPAAFAGVREKMRADQAAGCVPPAILLEKALPVFDAMLAGKATAQPLLLSFAERMAAAHLSRRFRTNAYKRAVALMDSHVRPAFSALRDETATLARSGRSDSGVWAQKDGEALYAANVRALGDTGFSPDEIHRVGIDEVSRIAGEMNARLVALGSPNGSIGERMAALARDPKNQFPDSTRGREALLTYVRGKVRDAEVRYGELLPADLIPRQALIVKRVPPATQAGAPGGFYDGPSLDGSRPGTYWINLRDMAAVARFRLPTLSYHEGVPGHHTQGAIAAALGEAPTLVRIASFNAYQEGWALYAERLMAELGAYKDDPLGDLGRLQDELFRAVRLVIDTGLHHKRWTREQAIRTMQDATGIAESRVTAEVERYMAWPGQALGYKLGQIRLLDMRARFLAIPGTTTRDFNGRVLGGGAMPLSLVETRLGLSGPTVPTKGR